MRTIVKNKMAKIMKLAYEISNETKADVFVHYYGHTNTFDVNYNEFGWKEGTESCRWLLISENMDVNNQSDLERLTKALNETIKELTSLNERAERV